MAITFKDWNIEAMTGYKPKTTYYMDFSIAEPFGISAIKDTYEKAMRDCKNVFGVEYLTELVMVLNWKIFEHYQRNDTLATLYNDLWSEADNYAVENLKGNDLMYFYRTTD